MIQLSIILKATHINDLKYNINVVSILIVEIVERNVKEDYSIIKNS